FATLLTPLFPDRYRSIASFLNAKLNFDKKTAPPIARWCLTIGVQFRDGCFFIPDYLFKASS
ncbi:hypothetical protein, partial [Paenibacillus alvei]|uniref:hypothetical protein n=1 Tax=Paenibacillus alvei TaxID=44250 RepID=UPI002280EC08